jgi:hypothetical protein
VVRRGLSEILLLLRIYVFVTLVPVLMHLRLDRVAALVEPRRIPSKPDETRIAAVLQATERVLASGRPLIRRGCLTRGLTLYYFLRRAGLDVTLLFGVGEVDGETAAHCWLVKDGQPFSEARDPRTDFVEVCRLSAGTSVAAA